ncbi:hypothetical protein DLM45_04025 [Hyphomicrobium methylovorum]|uniref:MAPEG family protein n=1 Tax=Hyphomicrobium methylovorum TaxID=84 RepID=UPI0015E769CB|nr:MAPEG family protein [Hyphomicrobium methylovorum]MBA2125393.1 hypothetical protein [Hyphomicrobium methylovorum]
MTVTDFLLPTFVLVALAFALHLMMARERMGALMSGKVAPKDVDLRQPNWPARATQIANAYHNQLELPMLYYVLIAFILITRVGDILLLVLAWLFVISRLVHAYIHVTSNNISWRSKVYGLGLVLLIAMWIIFAVKILTAA